MNLQFIHRWNCLTTSTVYFPLRSDRIYHVQARPTVQQYPEPLLQLSPSLKLLILLLPVFKLTRVLSTRLSTTDINCLVNSLPQVCLTRLSLTSMTIRLSSTGINDLSVLNKYVYLSTLTRVWLTRLVSTRLVTDLYSPSGGRGLATT